MRNRFVLDQSFYIEKGRQYMEPFIYKLNSILGTIGLMAEPSNSLPMYVIIKDKATRSKVTDWYPDRKLMELGVVGLGPIFQAIKFIGPKEIEYELVTTNKGRYELYSQVGDVKKELAVIFDDEKVTGIEISAMNREAGYNDYDEHITILNRPEIAKVQVQYCQDGNERALYYRHGGGKELYEVYFNEGRIDRDEVGERDVPGLTIKVLDDEHSFAYSSDERYGPLIPLTTDQAASYIKQGFSLPRNQQLFAHMGESLDEQYPGAMSLIAENLSDVFDLCSLEVPLDGEFVNLYESYTSPMVDFTMPINSEDAYVIDAREDIMIQ